MPLLDNLLHSPRNPSFVSLVKLIVKHLLLAECVLETVEHQTMMLLRLESNGKLKRMLMVDMLTKVLLHSRSRSWTAMVTSRYTQVAMLTVLTILYLQNLLMEP